MKTTHNDGSATRPFVTEFFYIGCQDPTPCDFLLWRYVRDNVFRLPQPANVEKLKVQMIAAIQTITSEMLWSSIIIETKLYHVIFILITYSKVSRIYFRKYKVLKMWYYFLIVPYNNTVWLMWFNTKMELVVNERNKTIILINYFQFRLQKLLQNDIERWKCTKNVYLHIRICMWEG